jgi:hypothetical protein
MTPWASSFLPAKFGLSSSRPTREVRLWLGMLAALLLLLVLSFSIHA